MKLTSRDRKRLGRVDRGVAPALQRILSSRLKGNITTIRDIPSREAIHADWPDDLPQSLRKALAEHGIRRPWAHQREAWDHAQAGRHAVVVTPTASGKTLCYNLPVLRAVLEDPAARALYVFPTKALSQDQVAELNTLTRNLTDPPKVFTFDGDTPHEERPVIRRAGQVIVTNPDMLHQAILPHHPRWSRLFENLRYIIIDELHTYRGLFGSHMANVLRRLKRIAAFHGSNPVFIMTSATIANPAELASALLEEPVEAVTTDGSPAGRKTFLCYNPPIVNKQFGIRASTLKQARNIALELLSGGVRTILFARSRLSVEVLTEYLKRGVARNKGNPGRIRGYRGGYLPDKRREIERGLREGTVDCVVSTNALELGIDIGGLDAAILCGYPGTVASTWQQAGRSGRRQGDSLAVLVAQANALDQFLIENPEWFFERPPEHARINPDNLLVLLAHVKCAAFELPFRDGENFGQMDVGDVLEYLAEERVVHRSEGQWHWMTDDYPADRVSLRSVTAENFLVLRDQERSRVIAEVDYGNAAKTIFPGAIYLLEGRKFKVTSLDWAERRAYVEDADDDYYTDALSYTRVTILDVEESRSFKRSGLEHGEVRVVEHVPGFKKIRFESSENVGFGDINLPDNQLHTTACWCTPDPDLAEELGLSRTGFVDAIAALGRVIHSLATLFLMCDQRDLSRSIGDKSARWFLRLQREEGHCTVETEAGSVMPVDGLDRFEPTFYLYDSVAGGVGFAESLYERFEGLLTAAASAIRSCPCAAGCPVCVGPPETDDGATKRAALALVERLSRDM